MAYNIVAIVGSLRKEAWSLKVANALAKLAPASLKIDVTTLHGISFFNQDLEAAPAGRLAGVPRKAAEVERRAVRHPRIQPLDPGRVEERHRRRLAALWQELVPRQADRHRLQFAGRARRRQPRPNICRISCRAFPGRSWGSRKSTSTPSATAFDDKGQLTKRAGAEGAAAVSSTPSPPSSKSRTNSARNGDAGSEPALGFH